MWFVRDVLVVIMSFIAQIFFKERMLDEEGYILAVKKNGLQILIPKYGLEGTIYLNKTCLLYTSPSPRD